MGDSCCRIKLISFFVYSIAVLCCTPNAFALGTLHPLGKLASKIRNIKSYGFSVVVVVSVFLPI